MRGEKKVSNHKTDALNLERTQHNFFCGNLIV